tara:strand:- start:9267 stop:9632 length:366 start_codon:yes stop_codon:yes gene_type:complete
MSRLTITDLETFKGTKTWECERSHGLKAIGSFHLKGVNQDFILYPLDEWEQKHYADIQKKDSERLFRYETHTTKIGGFFPMIKVNVESGLVYFQEDIYDEDMTFQKISEKPQWIDLNKIAI